MKAGDTFITTKVGAKVDNHLMVIVSDPAQNMDHIVLVTFTTYRSGKDRTCLLEAGDHEFVRHTTVIAYGYAETVPAKALNRMVAGGMLKRHRPVSRALLARIRKGAGESDEMLLGPLEILRDQGLVD